MPIAPLSTVRMYYEEVGSGEPLLITTGWAQAERAFAGPRERLAALYRCIRHDHRLIGRSVAEVAPITIARMADDLAELLDHLGIDRARVLGGGGMGAIVAMELAIRHPDRVRSMHLGTPCLRPDAFLVSIMRLWKRLRRLDPVLWAEEVTHWCFTPDTFAADPGLAESSARARAGERTFPDDACFEHTLDAYIAHDMTATAGQIRCPVQISNGGELDLITGPRMAREVHAAIPGSEMVIFEQSSHNYFTEEAGRFSDMLVDWFGRT